MDGCVEYGFVAQSERKNTMVKTRKHKIFHGDPEHLEGYLNTGWSLERVMDVSDREGIGNSLQTLVMAHLSKEIKK